VFDINRDKSIWFFEHRPYWSVAQKRRPIKPGHLLYCESKRCCTRPKLLQTSPDADQFWGYFTTRLTVKSLLKYPTTPWNCRHHWRRSLVGGRTRPLFVSNGQARWACLKMIFLPCHIELIRVIMHASKNRFKVAYFHKSVVSFWGLRPQTSHKGSGPHWGHGTKTPILACPL